MIDKYIDLVNNQVSFHGFQKSKQTRTDKVKKQQRLEKDFFELGAFLISIKSAFDLYGVENIKDVIDKNKETKAQLPELLDCNPDITQEDLEGLTEEQIEMLDIPKADRQELDIVEIIQSVGGTATVRKVMIGLLKKNGEMPDKQYINNKMYRMTHKENPVLFRSDMGQGYYTTVEPDEEEFDPRSVVGSLD